MAISSIQPLHGDIATNNATAASSFPHTRLFWPPTTASCEFRGPWKRYLRRFGSRLVSFGGRSRNLAAVPTGDRVEAAADHPSLGDSQDSNGIDDKRKQEEDAHLELQERDFTGTAYVPVYVMLPLGIIDMNCDLVDPKGLVNDLKVLKSANIDGVMIDCWWGIVEANVPQVYNWKGYKMLFQIVCDLKLKLQVVMSFHECGGNVGDDVNIPLPHWVTEIGQRNPDIHFTDRNGRSNTECLTWELIRNGFLGAGLLLRFTLTT
uniref:Beta-amylase n=2 Tax=Rhizophora mucronata TaxID=61149 RepID=A0A2P2KIF5_RHIMU